MRATNGHAVAVPGARRWPCSALAVLLPMVLTVGYSFTEWNGFGPMTFVGLDNYVRAAHRRRLPRLVRARADVHRGDARAGGAGRPRAGRARVSMRRGRLWFRVAIFTPGDAADGRRRGAVVVRLQPRLRAASTATLEAVGLEDLQRIWLGDPSTALLAVSVVSGWVFAGLLHDDLLRRVPAGPVRGPRGGAPRWRGRVGAVPAGQGADDPRRRRGRRAAVRDRRLPGLRPVLRAHQRRPVRRDRDPDDAPGQDRVPQRRGRLRLGDGGAAHRDRASGVGLVYVAAPGRGRSDRRGRRPRRRCADDPGPSGPGGRLGQRRLLAAARQRRRWSLLAVVFFFPMVWMVLSSFKTNRAIFRSPFALPETIDLVALGRGVGGRQPRPVRAQQGDRDGGLGDADPASSGAAAAFAFSRYRFRGRGLVMGLFALGLLLPLQSYFIAQSNLFTQLAITDTLAGADHPVHGDGPAARGLPAQGLPRRAARGAVRGGAHRRRGRRPRVPRARAAAAAARARDGRDLLRARVPGTSSCWRCCTSRTTTSRRSRPGCSRSPAAT